ncbi:MAG TPA: HlyD family secretion protein [Kofleriaceae bacterium]|nr:HlyD family secretion protein [Kofleriaceae bacterium]
MAEPAVTTKATVVAPIPRKKKAMRAYLLLAGLALAALAVYFIHGYLTRDEVSTDDAEVDADVVPVSARVGGVILHMHVTDNQRVDAGAVIAEIDPADYAAKVDAAQADLDGATDQADAADQQIDITKSASSGGLSSAKAIVAGTAASVRTAAAQVQAASAALASAEAQQTKANDDLARAKMLHDAGAVSGQALEAAQVEHDAAVATVNAAKANLSAARDQQAAAESRVAEAAGHLEQSTPVARQIAAAAAAARLAHARVKSAQAALDLAKLQLGYTKIVSPVSGYASRLAVHDGQMVQPGTMLLMVVPVRTYVIANFKETQMDRIAPGDAVDISVDALGGKTLHGRVDSVSAGTGARFSMMPPDNATGNFVKVVQRVPVKITFDDGQDLSSLHAGLSVEVKVHLK